MSFSILRLKAVLTRTGLSRSTIYVQISKGLWPKPIRMGPRAMGWADYEVDAMITARVEGKSEITIRWLVSELHLKRMSSAANTTSTLGSISTLRNTPPRR